MGRTSAPNGTASSRSVSSDSSSSAPTSPGPSAIAWPVAASPSRRSPAATRTSVPARPSGCSDGSRASCATSTWARSSSGAFSRSSMAAGPPATVTARQSSGPSSWPEYWSDQDEGQEWGAPHQVPGPGDRGPKIMCLRIPHHTKLTYPEPVSQTVFEVRMAPPSDEDQTNLAYQLWTVPSAPVTVYRDGSGNRVDLF